MKEHIQNEIFEIAGRAADQIGVQAFVIGGFVRDIFLNREVSPDIDIVAVGRGIQLAEKVKELLGGDASCHVYKNFGTARVEFQGKVLEFVGARKESYRSDSRKPVVEDGSLEDDQNRRDFTINAMAIGLNGETFGKLLDPFQGLEDIKNKIIRTPLDPNVTFSDDPLRMMRAVRFSSQLNFLMTHSVFESIQNNIERIGIVSMERIRDELNKIILSEKPSYGFKLLLDSGLLDRIFPEMVKLQGVETIEGKSHKDNFYHTLEVLDNLSIRSGNLWLRWAAILHDIAKPATKKYENEKGWTFHGHEDKGARMVPKIFDSLKLPLHDPMKYVQKLVLLHLRPIALVKSEVTDSAVRRLLFDAGDDIDDLMLLCQADITTKSPMKKKRYLENFEVVERKLREIEAKDNLRNWQPPVSGELIMETLKIPACREVGVIKNAIREAILDGKIGNNYEEAFQYMLLLAREKGLLDKSNFSDL